MQIEDVDDGEDLAQDQAIDLLKASQIEDDNEAEAVITESLSPKVRPPE